MGKRILFVNADYSGHVFPTLGVVAELVRRSHSVTYAVPADLAAAVRSTGAEVLAFEAKSAGVHPLNQFAEFANHGMALFIEDGLETIRVAKERFAADPPDIVVYDQAVSHVGRSLADEWRCPAVKTFSVFANNDKFSIEEKVFGAVDIDLDTLVSLGSKMTETLAAYGIAGSVNDFFAGPTEELNLVFMPQEFQFCGETFDERFAFVGPCLDERPFLGGWEPPASGLPVVLISLSTGYDGRLDFFRACAKAFDGVPWHVVMSVGPKTDPAELGPVPRNIEVCQWVPFMTVLKHAEVVVTHGGMGTMMESFHAGRPLVVVPQTADGAVAAERVAELGLGRVINADDVTAEELLSAVLEIAADGVVKKHVQEMRRQVGRAGGSRRAADKIEAHAR